MKEYILSFAASTTHKPEHPERTSVQMWDWDMKYREWPNRPSMAKAIRMQEKREHHSTDFKAVVPLSDGEGY